MVGLALGDALGAPFEGGPLERLVWWGLGRTRDGRHRTTDDTAMTRDIAESLLACRALDLDDLAQRFARSYRWHRGYGPGAAAMLRSVRRGTDWRVARTAQWPEGSWGNGGAMRAPILGALLHEDGGAAAAAGDAVASVTHAHPEGRAGASILARATAACVRGASPVAIVEEVAAHHADPPWASPWGLVRAFLDAPPSVATLRKELGNEITAIRSVPTALYLGLSSLDEPFEHLLSRTRALGGDDDALGAMAGALWGARHGASALPQHLKDRVEDVGGLAHLARSLAGVSIDWGPGLRAAGP